jgi:hypothetical protein
MEKEALINNIHGFCASKDLPTALITLYAEELYEEYGPEHLPDHVVSIYASAFLVFSTIQHDYLHILNLQTICMYYSIDPMAVEFRILDTIEHAGFTIENLEGLENLIQKGKIQTEKIIKYFIIIAADWSMIEFFGDAIKETIPGSPHWWILKARIHEYYGQFQEAENCFLEALYENYESAYIWQRRMEMYTRIKHPLKARMCRLKLSKLQEEKCLS